MPNRRTWSPSAFHDWPPRSKYSSVLRTSLLADAVDCCRLRDCLGNTRLFGQARHQTKYLVLKISALRVRALESIQ